jgi:hypothetical protein
VRIYIVSFCVNAITPFENLEEEIPESLGVWLYQTDPATNRLQLSMIEGYTDPLSRLESCSSCPTCRTPAPLFFFSLVEVSQALKWYKWLNGSSGGLHQDIALRSSRPQILSLSLNYRQMQKTKKTKSNEKASRQCLTKSRFKQSLSSSRQIG